MLLTGVYFMLFFFIYFILFSSGHSCPVGNARAPGDDKQSKASRPEGSECTGMPAGLVLPYRPGKDIAGCYRMFQDSSLPMPIKEPQCWCRSAERCMDTRNKIVLPGPPLFLFMTCSLLRPLLHCVFLERDEIKAPWRGHAMALLLDTA